MKGKKLAFLNHPDFGVGLGRVSREHWLLNSRIRDEDTTKVEKMAGELERTSGYINRHEETNEEN